MRYDEEYTRSIRSPEEFWREQAARIDWFVQPYTILSKDESGFYRWFADGTLNTAYLALDRQVERGRGEQLALIYDSPVTASKCSYTYRELTEAVSRLAGGLKELGIARGDTVVIYMPMIPQTIMAMLACARIGAIHSVVFGGFASHELAIRIDDARPKVLLTASAGKERQRTIDYLSIVHEAIAEVEHPPERCVVYQRDFHPVELRSGIDLDWEQVSQSGHPASCVELSATDPLYILYTSGTTGKPKGILRDNGGHAVAMKYSMDAVYDAQPGEVFWAASDVGWVVGHSYIAYGPLIQGCTSVLYEGKPVGTPDAGAFWRVASEHNVRVMFTAPTAMRAIKAADPEGQLLRQYDTSSLKYLFLAGERCDVPTLQWAQQLLNVPVIDHWWQTESGWPMVANSTGVELLPIKPGSATKPVCGYDLRVLDFQGNELPANQEGAIAIRLPLPPGNLPNLWHNTERFRKAYLQTYPGYYLSGDGGYVDEDGYVFITGRLDDVINVAGHRLSTATMEEIVAEHPDVAECAVIGVAHELKGQAPLAFVVAKRNSNLTPEELREQVQETVREKVGHIASLQNVIVASRLPKTRSGKILRRTMRSMVEGESFMTPSTIEDRSVLDELADTVRETHSPAHLPA